MANWTAEKNAICFYELKDYIKYLSTLDAGTVTNEKISYINRLINNYPLLKEHGNASTIVQHMDYLYALSLGEKGTRTEKDKCYFGILNNPNKYVSDGTLEEVGEDLEEMNEQTEIDIAEQETEDISLSDNQVDSLLSFIGYGNLSEANIAFFGNEGGLGGKTPKENIDLLTNLYKKYPNQYLDGKWEDGYWNVEKWNSEESQEPVPNSPFLYLSSRIILALENQEKPIDTWFKTGDSYTRSIVRNFIATGGLYSNRPGIKTALFDWRPLPRSNQRSPIPYSNVDKKKYLDAFAFKNTPNNPYSEWVQKRIKVIKNTFNKFDIDILLSFGEVDTKKQLFKNIWENVEFEHIVLEPSNKEIHISKSKVGKNTTIILAKFLSYEHFGYAGARDLTKYIQNHLISKKNTSV